MAWAAAALFAFLSTFTPQTTAVLVVKQGPRANASGTVQRAPKGLTLRRHQQPQDCNGPAFEPWFKLLASLAPHGPGSGIGRAYVPRGNTTLLVESDVSAWNNVRMSWEMAVCLAYKTRRLYRVPHIPTNGYADARLKFSGRDGKARSLNMFDYFDEASFRRVIPAVLDSEPLPPGEVFNAKVGPFESSEKITSMTGPEYTHLVYQGGPNHMSTRVFGEYANEPDLTPRDEYIHLVSNAFRLRSDLICRAVRRLVDHGLAPLEYVALHRRRGDSVGLQGYDVGMQEAVNHVAPFVRNQTVLVLTDMLEPSFVKSLKEVAGAKRVVTWADDQREGPEEMYAAQVDMLSAVPAKHFIGSPLSTFSTGIIRWRTQVGTHKIGLPVQFTKSDYSPGYDGWPSPGDRGSWLLELATARQAPTA